MMALTHVIHEKLNARQKEVRNFHKIAARLSDYGFHSMWLSDDWQGADFLAVHIDGATVLRVQLKARATIDRKYIGKGLHVAFRDDDGTFRSDEDTFLYRHDDLVAEWQTQVPSGESKESWQNGSVHWSGKHRPKWLNTWLASHRL